jgi:hypothetical protein
MRRGGGMVMEKRGCRDGVGWMNKVNGAIGFGGWSRVHLFWEIYLGSHGNMPLLLQLCSPT